jgi:type I restriction enzyme, R subunit
LLRYSQNFPIAIVEAKKKYKLAADGIQQAKDYAQILGLKFAYSTNGTEILEFDFITGLETKVSKYPTPTELWNRLNQAEPIKPEIQETFLKPFLPIPNKPERYYQTIAINRAVKAVLEGKKRALLTLRQAQEKQQLLFKSFTNFGTTVGTTKANTADQKYYFLPTEVF